MTSDSDDKRSSAISDNETSVLGEDFINTISDLYLYYYTVQRLKGKSSSEIKKKFRKKFKKIMKGRINGLAS